jgi:hypothetical protein
VRNAAIRAARAAHFRDPRVTVAAERLASALVAYAASNWRAERHMVVLPSGSAAAIARCIGCCAPATEKLSDGDELRKSSSPLATASR